MAAEKATVNFSFILTFRKMSFRSFWCSHHCDGEILEDDSVYLWSPFSPACLLLPFPWWPLQWTVCEYLPLTTSFICFLEAPLGSLISNHVSCQVGIILGGLLASTGLILSSFATSLEHLYLSLGVLTGRRHSAPLFLPGKQHGNVKNDSPPFWEGWSFLHVILSSHWWIEMRRPVLFTVKERLWLPLWGLQNSVSLMRPKCSMLENQLSNCCCREDYG